MAKPAKKQGGRALAAWDAELAKIAAEQQKTEATAGGGGNFIKIRAGVLTINGGVVPGGKIRAIVLDSILENRYYKEGFTNDSKDPPVCYAFGRDAKKMEPHEDATEQQSEDCASCEWNKFGSAEKGAGKACKNTRRLALILAEFDGEIEDQQIMLLSVPPTSGPNWKGYVESIASVTKNKATCGVVTEITVSPHATKQVEVSFKLSEEIDDAEIMGVIMQKLRPEAQKLLTEPYRVLGAEEEEEAPAPARRGIGKAAAAPARAGKPAAAPTRAGKGAAPAGGAGKGGKPPSFAARKRA